MNFDSDKDLSRLVKICNLYGLDEEETNQLITEFRIGALSGNNNQLSDSLGGSNDSLASPQQLQEYSFKHPTGKKNDSFSIQQYHNSQECHEADHPDAQLDDEDDKHGCSTKLTSQYEYLEVQHQPSNNDRNLYLDLKHENEQLHLALSRRDQQISNLIGIVQKDAEVIEGLKDLLSTLTANLNNKDAIIQQLEDKYSREFLIDHSEDNHYHEAKQSSKESMIVSQEDRNISLQGNHRKLFREETKKLDSEVNDLNDVTNSFIRNKNKAGSKEKQELREMQSKGKNDQKRSEKENRRIVKIDMQKYKGIIGCLQSYCELKPDRN